ncbi:MAG: insulinase family protein [Bacteroidia bacterium]|nr:insulinase family protein [Bacteroidia bacterium]
MYPVAPGVWFWPKPSALSVYTLLLWDVGSRHDPPGHEGLLHFLEHTLFKGTKRHKGKELFQRIEKNGGELNAFTTKDKMAIEGRVAPRDLALLLHTFHELAHEATFPEKEVEKEREVILEELAMYEDIPEESLLDKFEEQIFAEGGLKHPIIGYPESVRATQAADLRRFYERELAVVPWVLLVTGPVTERALGAALKSTGWHGQPPPQHKARLREEQVSPPSFQRYERPTQQVHLAVGGIGPAAYDWEAALPLQLLLHEIGGPHMSSRLNSLLRERYGWAYTVYSFWQAYPEKSVWGIYAGLSPEAAEKALRLIHRELERWAEKPSSPAVLARIKRSFLGRQALTYEVPSHRLYIEGRFLLDQGQPLDLRAWQEAVAAVTPQALQEAAQQAFRQVYTRLYAPIEKVPQLS